MFPRTAQIALIILSSLFVIGFILLDALDKDTDTLRSFALLLLPMLGGILFNTHQLDKVSDKTSKIEKRINGGLTEDIKSTVEGALNNGTDNGGAKP